MITLTEKQRRALVDLCDGEWRSLVADCGHSLVVISNLEERGLIRPDWLDRNLDEREYTITPEGLAALEATE